MSIPEDYFKAGRIASKVRNEIRERVRVGMSYLEIAETVENMTRSNGGEPAFPCNICPDRVAAHYTPVLNDEKVVEKGVLLKIDMGVHVNGFLVDTATTISFNPEYDGIAMAAEHVLQEAVKAVREGVRAGDIGRIISSATSCWGFRTIRNLSGHMIEPYTIHAGFSIPNVWVAGTQELKTAQVYAIEPFLTLQEGSGLVVDSETRNIFSIIARKKTGDARLDEFLKDAWTQFRTLPFASRYFKDINQKELDNMISRLLKLKVLRSYPVLVEAKAMPVAQAEHTIAVSKDGAVILT